MTDRVAPKIPSPQSRSADRDQLGERELDSSRAGLRYPPACLRRPGPQLPRAATERIAATGMKSETGQCATRKKGRKAARRVTDKKCSCTSRIPGPAPIPARLAPANSSKAARLSLRGLDLRAALRHASNELALGSAKGLVFRVPIERIEQGEIEDADDTCGCEAPAPTSAEGKCR